MSLFEKFFRGAAAAATVAVGVGSADAQQPGALPPAIADLPGLTAENPIQPASGFGRHRGAPNCAPCVPCPPAHPGYPCPPGYTHPPVAPPMGDPMVPPVEPPVTQPPVDAPSFDFGDLGRGAGVGPTVGQNGYIENAVPVNMVRVRFDAGYGMNRPDRGGFFYARGPSIRPRRPAVGPGLVERNLDYQELTTSVENAVTERFSGFYDIPVRFLNPDSNRNASGLGDIGFGAKYAFLYNANRVASLFLRFQAPAGDISTGLGNGNWWIEPGLLYLEQLSQRWQMFGEFRFLTPLGLRGDGVGNLIRYGVGSSYVVAQGCWGYVAPVVEFVGWTALSGQTLDPDSLQTVGASGDTIVNGKFGLRIGFGRANLGSAYPTRSDLYIGYGRALTGEVWYKDLMRLEYRFFY